MILETIQKKISKEISEKYWSKEFRQCDSLNVSVNEVITTFSLTPTERVELIKIADNVLTPYLVDPVAAATYQRNIYFSYKGDNNDGRNAYILWLNVETPGYGVYHKEQAFGLFSDVDDHMYPNISDHI
jgi:hypothetical protein